MGWKRNQISLLISPSAPSLIWWSLSGILVIIVGVLLFIIHASGHVKMLNMLSIWWFSLTPPGIWFLLFLLRCWQWNNQIDKYLVLKKENEYAQMQWEVWAERYLVISASSVMLPGGVTAGAILKSLADTLPSGYLLTKRLKNINTPVTSALASLQLSVCQLPAALPVNVTLIADLPDSEIRSAFVSAWEALFPQRVVPDNIEVTPDFSMGWVDERLKQPVLTVDLILVIQLNGGNAYSDGLAALLLTSDDVAQKYNLPHPARLLRPMSLDINKFNDEFTLFLETQTAACRTARVLGDCYHWEKIAAPLMTIGNQYGAGWEPSGRMLLEKWCGILGPAAPWLLTALAADLVCLGNDSLLALFSSGEEHFISTVTSGNQNE
ncbi:putative type VI secretion protein [Escherichia coli]|uniref:type VI secretion protein n=1 Tax=Escherichia coli TaxID=562 RepID=UPI00191B63DA|nr:type VI secretion protein [Escherichia coli]CAD5757236.1 putative type VI secretion protein [Escherichia coli]